MKKPTAICVCALMLLFAASVAQAATDNVGDMAVGTWTTNPRTITFGNYNGHDLVWRVLEVSTTDADNRGNKTALLLLDDVLRDGSGDVELRQFHSTDSAGDNDWNKSDIKAFLNGQFLGAFTAAQQAGIVTSNYVYGGPNEGNDTAGSSKVFLLSVDEAMNPQYFADGENWGANADRAAPYHWWLRSPGPYPRHAAHVFTSGLVRSNYLNVFHRLAVRPALKINLSSSIFESASVPSSEVVSSVPQAVTDDEDLKAAPAEAAADNAADMIVGTWVTDEGAEFAFSGDGTVVASFNEDTLSGTYSTGGNMLSITIQARTEYAEFNISGNKLVLTERGRREIVVLTRK